MLIWQDQQNVSTFLGTVPALLGADASGNVLSIVLGTNLSFAGNVLNAAGGTVSLPAGEIGYGTGAGITSSPILTFSTVLDQLQISFTKATGTNGINITNSSNGVGAYAEFALTNDLGPLSRSDVYYTSSTYTGTESFPSSLSMATAGGAGSKIVFLPNNTQALVVSTTGIEIPTSDGGTTISVKLSQAAGQSIDKSGGSLFVGTSSANLLAFYTSNATRLSISAGGAVTVNSLGTAMTKAVAGVLTDAVAGTDFQAPITWPAATDVLVSSGASTAPVGDSNFTYDTTAHTLSLTGATPLLLPLAGAQIVKKHGGTLTIETDDANSLILGTNAANRIIIDSTGKVFVGSLVAGGMVKANAATAELAIASAADIAAAQVWPTASQVLVSAGTAVAPLGDGTFTFDRVAHVMAGGNAIGINGVSVPTNCHLVTGSSNNTDRDRQQHLVGGGALGPTGASDSTLIDISPISTSLNSKSVTAPSIYATARIRRATYTGGTLGDAVGIAASLYVDNSPSLTVAAGPTWGVYVAGGGMHVVGQFEATSSVTAPVLNGNGTSNAFRADGSTGTPAVGFFGAGGGLGVPQQTGGAASAGATYTATEQGMINRMYGALRTYGLLT